MVLSKVHYNVLYTYSACTVMLSTNLYFRQICTIVLLRTVSTFGDKGVAVFTGGAHNLSFSKKNLRITPDPDFRHFRNVLV